MGRKHVTNKFPVVVSGDMSGDIDSLVTDVEQCDHCRYTGSYTGVGLVGFLQVYTSDDKTLWEELPFIPFPVTATGEEFVILITQIDFKYIKLTYRSSAGTGTLNAYIKAASVGA